MKKPSAPKRGRAQKNLIECSSDSLAVFYVEQVALNRHVSSRRYYNLPPMFVNLSFCDLPEKPPRASQGGVASRSFQMWVLHSLNRNQSAFVQLAECGKILETRQSASAGAQGASTTRACRAKPRRSSKPRTARRAWLAGLPRAADSGLFFRL